MLGKCVYILVLLGVLAGAGAAGAQDSLPMRPSEHRGIERVREYLALEEYAEAVEVLTPLLERAEHHPLVDFYRGVIAQYRQEYADACSWFERSVARDPALMPGWVNLAQCRFQVQEYPAAAQAYMRSYALSTPPEPRWGYNAALSRYLAGELPRARDIILQLLDDFPAAAQLRWRELLVRIYLDQEGEQNYRRALPHVQVLARESAQDARRRWREYLIHLYLQLNMPEEAREFVTHLLEEEILEPRWWRIAAHLDLQTQNYAGALVALQVTDFLAPGDADEERLRADLCMQLGIPVQALAYFSDLLEEDPAKSAESGVLLGLAQAYVQRHEPRKALEYLQRIDTAKEDVPQLRLRAQILYMLQDYARAHVACVELAQREQQGRDSARAWLMAGYAAWNAGETGAAQKALQHAAREPDFSAPAQRLLRHMQSQR